MISGGARRRATRSTSVLTGALLLVLGAALSGCVPGAAASGHALWPGEPHIAAAHPTPSATPLRTPPPTVTPTPRPTPTTPVPPTPAGPPAFDRTAHSVDDAASPWVVVNKSRALSPADYAPADLVYPDVRYMNRQPMRQGVATALVAMFEAGKREAGLDFSVQSAYRSYDSQTRVYDEDVDQHGKAYADTDTARPGHSEHQTGLAVDISAVPARCSLDACFGETPQGEWLAANAWRFGFLLRYPADKVAITGFTFEPWHFRFVGDALAAELHRTGVTTLEEFFSVPGGTDYH